MEMSNSVNLPVLRSRFLTNWIVVRVLGLIFNIQALELNIVFVITVFLTFISLIPRILWSGIKK